MTVRRTIVLAAAGALVIAVHLSLGGALVANWRWTGASAVAVLAVALVVLALKVGLVVMGRLGIHGRRSG